MRVNSLLSNFTYFDIISDFYPLWVQVLIREIELVNCIKVCIGWDMAQWRIPLLVSICHVVTLTHCIISNETLRSFSYIIVVVSRVQVFILHPDVGSLNLLECGTRV